MSNREHLFRGKRKDNGEWVEGHLLRYESGRARIIPSHTDIFCYENDENIIQTIAFEVIPETVGEWTGLRDKNDRRIFEGDIAESRASENTEDWKRWKVGYIDGSFVFTQDRIYRKKRKYEENLLCVDEIKLYGLVVIGNVHDNPELLEVSWR